MGSERVVDVPVRRHVFDSQLPFQTVLDGIYGGISRPDIESLFGKLQAATSYEQFSDLVRQAQGSAGLMRFWQLDLDTALARDPQARGQGGHHPHPGDAGRRDPGRLRLRRQRDRPLWRRRRFRGRRTARRRSPGAAAARN